ncbi:MAG: manganese efflux pump [Bacteroidales bacterium]|nr:manganese efflux pump [Candidatus Cryptobacteroides onthequi]
MISAILFALVFGMSLCADCFAVSLCSSVTLKSVKLSEVARVAVMFAVIQTAFMVAGWAFGNLFVGFLDKAAHIIGFLLLLYVGGSMLVEGIKGEDEVRDLNGWRNVIIGGVATSIDALAVGISLSMDSKPWLEVMPLAISVFICTLLSVVLGIWTGKTIGGVFGRWAEAAGGVVLILIGIGVLI